MKKEDLRPLTRPKRAKYNEDHELIGKTINNWKVLRVAGVPKKGTSTIYWECECLKCGEIYYQRAHRIANENKNKQCQKCTDYTSRKGPDSPLWNGGDFISGWFFNNYKVGAKRRGIEFNLTVEEAEEVLREQNFKCNYSGVQIKTSISRNDDFSASIDRIDNNKGYTKDNIQWLHKTVNRMKNNMTEQEFLNWCKLINQHE